jgi:hypothetical protein
MRSFHEFGITTTRKAFTGNKINIELLFNKEIIVHAYKIEPSKFEGKGDRLVLQFTLNDEKRIVFTGSPNLIELIQRVPESDFPFKTIIKKDEAKTFQFT